MVEDVNEPTKPERELRQEAIAKERLVQESAMEEGEDEEQALSPWRRVDNYANWLLIKLGMRSNSLRRVIKVILAILGGVIFLVNMAPNAQWVMNYINPRVEIIVQKGDKLSNVLIHFKARHVREDINDDWIWNYGDGTDEVDSSSHIFKYPGTFKVTLTHRTATRFFDPLRAELDIAINDASKNFESSQLLFAGEEPNFFNIPPGAKVYRWYFEKVVTDNGSQTRILLDVIEKQSEREIPNFQYEPGEYNVYLQTEDKEGTNYVRYYKLSVQADENDEYEIVEDSDYLVEREDIVIPRKVREDPRRSTHRMIYISDSQLSSDFTVLANEGVDRQKKRNIVKRIERDVVSIDILVNETRLEDFLKEIQIEASDKKVTITVTNIQRNGNNKIQAITITRG